MRWPIRNQLLLPPLVLIGGVVGIASWTTMDSVNRARDHIEEQVRHVAETLSEYPFALSATVLQQMKGLSGADYLLVGSTERMATFDAEQVTPPQEAVYESWHDLHLGPRVTVGNRDYLCSGLRLQRGHLGKTLYILYPEELWRDARWTAIRPSLLLGGFCGLAALGLSVIVGLRLGQRIRQLDRHTRLIADGDFSPMPLPRQDDELHDLGRSVNEMAGRLTQLQETVQKTERLQLLGQIGGGLAHQLRNGISGARLAVQLHARECQHGDPEGLRVALRQLHLLEANLKRFLALGRQETQKRERSSLTRLVSDAVELLTPQSRHTNVELHWQPPTDAMDASVDTGQLEQMLLNVLHNAIEAAGPGGSVAVTIDRYREGDSHASRCRIDVADSGPGPAKEIADRMFEVFVTSKPEGVGLGLAAARQVAEAHGGRLDWRREHGRTVFRMELPLDEPDSDRR